MALYTLGKICWCALRTLAPRKIHPWPYLYLSLHQLNKDDSGILDSFTSQLMEQKSNKWERRKVLTQNKIKNKLTRQCEEHDIGISIEELDSDTIQQLFQRAMDYDDGLSVLDLIRQCVKYDIVPPLPSLLYCLAVCSRNGDKGTIVEVSRLCERVRPEILQENSNFEHYMAEAVWIKGDVIQSLKIFEKVYRENVFLRRAIRNKLKHIILSSVSSRSEATLTNLIQFSEMLVKDFNDYFTLGCIWQACILSEWFTDQEIALELLSKYSELCTVIVNKIPHVVRISLRNHRTEVVYRLNEVLLKLEMKAEISQVLLALLDYWVQQGDFRQCREIVLWTINSDIEMPRAFQNMKLVKLLAKDIKENKRKSVHDLLKPSQTEYKF